MQDTVSETEVTLRGTLAADGRRPIHRRGLAGRDCRQMPNDVLAPRTCENTQCFMCSRIYFDQSLSKCPHCNSDSLQHYATADLNYFARDPVKAPFRAGTLIEKGEQGLR